jgi:hypothetical protein
MWPFDRRENEEDARILRIEAGRLRILGNLDAAYKKYKRAYAVYERCGDIDAQCSVLCSLAETTASNDERRIFLGKIQALCDGIQDREERDRELRNLAALRKRLNN